MNRRNFLSRIVGAIAALSGAKVAAEVELEPPDHQPRFYFVNPNLLAKHGVARIDPELREQFPDADRIVSTEWDSCMILEPHGCLNRASFQEPCGKCGPCRGVPREEPPSQRAEARKAKR